MRASFAVAVSAALAVAVSGCGTEAEQSPPAAEPSAPVQSSITTPPTPTSFSTPPTSAEPTQAVSETAAESAGAPDFVRCYLADGTALMSDGSTIYMDACNESAGGPPRLMDGRSIYDLEPSVDPADVPIADGGTCPAARCGYGHDANGNPNPSSGEIQAKHGCEQGYITDPELCAAVNRN